ncbi:hypothetical protein VPHD479_0311 [Vibrio phage D479]
MVVDETKFAKIINRVTTARVIELKPEAVKAAINEWLLDHGPLSETWSSGTVYSQRCECVAVHGSGLLEFEYIDSDGERSDPDEDFPDDDALNAWLRGMSARCGKSLYICYSYYSK